MSHASGKPVSIPPLELCQVDNRDDFGLCIVQDEGKQMSTLPLAFMKPLGTPLAKADTKADFASGLVWIHQTMVSC